MSRQPRPGPPARLLSWGTLASPSCLPFPLTGLGPQGWLGSGLQVPGIGAAHLAVFLSPVAQVADVSPQSMAPQGRPPCPVPAHCPLRSFRPHCPCRARLHPPCLLPCAHRPGLSVSHLCVCAFALPLAGSGCPTASSLLTPLGRPVPTRPLPCYSSARPPAGGCWLCLLRVAEMSAVSTGGGGGWCRGWRPFDPFRIKEGVVRQRQGDDKGC